MKHLEQATDRVNDNEQLAQYKDVLIEYDWDNYDEHIEWVATANIDEIIDWCQEIRKNEQS